MSARLSFAPWPDVEIVPDVPTVHEHSAEEFFTRRLGDAQVLLAAARARLAAGDVVSAVAAMSGSDVAALQALLWERINVAPRAPVRQLFQAGDAITALLAEYAERDSGATVADVLTSARRWMAGSLDDELAADAFGRWAPLTFLAATPAPSPADVAAFTQAALGGVSGEEFVRERRSAAQQAMLHAQGCRLRSDPTAAITAAYESDLAALEGYLVESAVAVGDVHLFSVVVRGELVSHAVAQLPGLPPGFGEAVATLRGAMTDALGDADGARLATSFVPI